MSHVMFGLLDIFVPLKEYYTHYEAYFAGDVSLTEEDVYDVVPKTLIHTSGNLGNLSVLQQTKMNEHYTSLAETKRRNDIPSEAIFPDYPNKNNHFTDELIWEVLSNKERKVVPSSIMDKSLDDIHYRMLVRMNMVEHLFEYWVNDHDRAFIAMYLPDIETVEKYMKWFGVMAFKSVMSGGGGGGDEAKVAPYFMFESFGRLLYAVFLHYKYLIKKSKEE